jgi:hypothetical protein
MSDIERVAIAMRHRYAEMTNDLPLVPFEKSKAKDEWLECARVAIEMVGATIESLTAERDRLRDALGPILTAHQERTERLHTMVLEAREAIRLNLEPDSPAWLRDVFNKLHAVHHGMGGDPFDMHIRAALTKEGNT